MSGLVSDGSVLCAGRLYCDLIFVGTPRLPTPGTEIFADGLSLSAGGGAAITAAGISALGRPSALLAVLPGAPFDSIVARDLAASGVDTRHCTPAPPDTDPQITVAVATGNDRAFLSRRKDCALPPLAPQHFLGHSHLHIGELTTLKEHPDLIAMARTANMTISLDCGWDDEWLNSKDDLVALISAVDVFLPNSDEFEMLKKQGVGAETAPLTVVKCGPDGARAFDNGNWLNSPAQSVDIVDTTGAGDAFNAGFLDGWLDGLPLKECLQHGNECGAINVQTSGGMRGAAQLGQTTSPEPLGVPG